MAFATLVLLTRAFGLDVGFWSSFMAFFQALTVALTAASLLDYLRLGIQTLYPEQVEVISPEEALLAAARRADVRSLFGHTHYTRETNALVADAVAVRLRAQLQQ